LANAVRTAHKGFTQLSPGILQKALAGSIESSEIDPIEIPVTNVLPFMPSQRRTSAANLPPGFAKLTTRERQVLRLIAEGSSNREIARTLDISEGTVKNHVASILGRLNLRDRTQAAIVATSVMPLLN
jgi:DNA-binding NarL/FixJ family response regulator